MQGRHARRLLPELPARSTKLSRPNKRVASCPAWSSVTPLSTAAGSTRPRPWISIVERGCLSRPVEDVSALEQRVRTVEDERNARKATIDWQFTNRQARVKLKKLYPVVKAQLD